MRDPKSRRLVAALARSGCAVSAVAFGLALVGATVSDVAPAAAATAGTAQIIEPTDGTGGGQLLAGGDSGTQFSLLLPAGAACAGDSANDDYRVGSYLVARSVDPATLTFDSFGPTSPQFGSPQATFRQPLHDTNGSAYAAAQTANAVPPPGPGPIVNIPAFTFNVYQPAGSGFDLPPGEYNIGIACYVVAPGSSPIEEYWNATIAVVAVEASESNPAGITWTVQAAATATSVTLAANPTAGAAPGATVTLTATVTPADAAGTITFKDDDVGMGEAVAVASGQASLQASELALGDHSLTASFTPADSGAYAPSTSSVLAYAITAGSATSTTAPRGATTTTALGASASVAAGSASGGGAGPSTGTPLSSLANTGGSLSLVVWAALTIIFGRMAMLLGRKPTVQPARTA